MERLLTSNVSKIVTYKIPDQKINFCSKFAINLKLFHATVANADIGSLKSLHTFLEIYHMPVKFEQNHMVQTTRSFELSLGELERRHIPNFGVTWHHLASFGVKWHHLASLTLNFASLTLNFASLTLIWYLWRQFSVSGADLASLAQIWRH